MAKLTPEKRAKLAKAVFAGPGRTYPVPDKNHARAALTGASHAEHVGNISEATKERIDAKARRVLAR